MDTWVVLAITANAAMSTRVQAFVWIRVFISLRCKPGRSVGSCGNSLSNFLRNGQAIAKSLLPLTFPPAVSKGSGSSTPSPTLVFVRLLDYLHPSGCKGISHCGFDLHLLGD